MQAETEEQIAEAKTLFREYEAWLGLDLCFQGFEAELAGLPGKYAQPGGRLRLAYVGENLAGCVALRSLDNEVCEMKRLFVRDGFRGQSIGVRLIRQVIADACEIGYSTIRLDTFPPKMGKAVSLFISRLSTD